MLFLNCQQATRLQSDALDQKLGLRSRIGLALHLLICKWCRRYGRQIGFLKNALRENPEALGEASPNGLPTDARERLKQTLRDAGK